MLKYITFFILLITAHHGIGQIKVLDSLTGNGIPMVNIYADTGDLLGVTNQDGEFPMEKLANASGKSIRFQHISYNSAQLSKSSVIGMKTIKLVARDISLQEVNLADISAYDYVVLKGYFRTTSFFSDLPHFFVDGEVEYYVPIHNKKEKVLHRILNYRVFVDTVTLKKQKDAYSGFVYTSPSILSIKSKSILQRLKNKDVLVKQGEKVLIKNANLNKGFSQKASGNNVQVYYDLLPPDQAILINLLLFKGKINKYVVTENYSNADLEDPATAQLTSSVNVISIGLKVRKSAYYDFDDVQEFYTQERRYMTKDDYKKVKGQLTKRNTLQPKSNYNTSYCTNLSNFDIPAVNEKISRLLGKEMQEQK